MTSEETALTIVGALLLRIDRWDGDPHAFEKLQNDIQEALDTARGETATPSPVLAPEAERGGIIKEALQLTRGYVVQSGVSDELVLPALRKIDAALNLLSAPAPPAPPAQVTEGEIIERCAKLVDEMEFQWSVSHNNPTAMNAAEQIAKALRALASPKEPTNV